MRSSSRDSSLILSEREGIRVFASSAVSQQSEPIELGKEVSKRNVLGRE